MFEAQYLFEDAPVFSPWMSRGGDQMRITLDFVATSNSSKSLVIDVFEKNSEQPGDGSAVETAAISESKVGVYTGVVTSAVKELVRYRITYGTDGGGDRALFRMLSNVWYDNVGA